MVGILADDYYLDTLEGTAVEGTKDIATRRVYHPTTILATNKGGKFLEIGLRELILEYLLPVCCYLYIYHMLRFSCEDRIFSLILQL
jgi:hypothetical protein